MAVIHGESPCMPWEVKAGVQRASSVLSELLDSLGYRRLCSPPPFSSSLIWDSAAEALGHISPLNIDKMLREHEALICTALGQRPALDSRAHSSGLQWWSHQYQQEHECWFPSTCPGAQAHTGITSIPPIPSKTAAKHTVPREYAFLFFTKKIENSFTDGEATVSRMSGELLWAPLPPSAWLITQQRETLQ